MYFTCHHLYPKLTKRRVLIFIFLLIVFHINVKFRLWTRWQRVTSFQHSTLSNKLVSSNCISKLLCANETLTEIIRSQSSWITFLNSLNTANINDNQSIKQFKKSTGLSVFSLTSIPYINGTKELFNFKIQFKVELKRGHDADILNLRYEKKTGEENHTRSRHHPKSFDMSTYLNAISVGFSKPEAAINNINLLVIQFPRNGCNACLQEEKLDLVVIVKSCVYCFEHRKYARQTYMKTDHWNDFKVQFIFVVGLPTPNGTNIYHFDGVSVELNMEAERLSSKLESSRWSTMKQLTEESRSHGDILIGGFYDNYFNLTTKMVLKFRYASLMFGERTPLFLFIDNDYILHPRNTINLVKSIHQKSNVRSFAGGSIHSTSIVTRATDDKLYSRWSISRKEYPWDYYPPFFQGGCYILGADLVRDASIAMSFTQNLRFDDVFLGIVLARLNKSLTLLKEIQNLADGNSNAAEMIIMGRLKANKYFLNRN